MSSKLDFIEKFSANNFALSYAEDITSAQLNREGIANLPLELTNFGVREILCSFRLVLEDKTGKEIPEPSQLEFLETFLVNSLALSDAEGNTSRSLNRGGIVDLPLLITLLTIHQTPERQVSGKF